MSQDQPQSAGDPSSPEQSVERAQAKLVELKQLQSTARKQLLGIVAVIVLMFLVFMYTTYHQLRENFNPEDVQKAMSARAVELAPQAGVRLRAAATSAAPVYRDLAMKRFQTVSPDVARQAVKRLETIPETTGKAMNERLKVTFDNVTKKLEPDVEKMFPSLDKDTQHKLMLEFQDKMIAQQNEEIKSHVSGLYTKELVRLQEALTKFDHTVPASANADNLSRTFLRSLVRYVDYLIVVGGEDHQKSTASLETNASRGG